MLDARIYPPGYGFTEVIAGTNTIQVSSGKGILNAIVFNNVGTAWEVDVYDGVSSSATLTEANESPNNPIPIAKIRSAAFGATPYNIPISQGIFIDAQKGTTQGDITVIYTNAI